MNEKIVLIVPAAGVGARFGQSIPKQYTQVLDAPIIEHTLSALIKLPGIAKIVVALHPRDKWFSQLEISSHPLLQTVEGGATRSESVQKSLLALQSELDENDWVAVHDVVRPGLSLSAWRRLMTSVASHDCGGLLALPVSDSVKRIDSEQQVAESVSREHLWLAQTPQVFRAKHLLAAYEQFGTSKDLTDESSLIEKLGLKPLVVMGETQNIKITYPEDLLAFQRSLKYKAYDYDESWAGI